MVFDTVVASDRCVTASHGHDESGPHTCSIPFLVYGGENVPQTIFCCSFKGTTFVCPAQQVEFCRGYREDETRAAVVSEGRIGRFLVYISERFFLFLRDFEKLFSFDIRVFVLLFLYYLCF
ncbi:ORF277 [White spot syndrome virus]|uniref:ORF277 n=1 Tax=White spot syndrome virus TaxID=342409 RepID=A0A2D3I5B2_9VIRU|nr:ORF277 [White spot syndrome virus]